MAPGFMRFAPHACLEFCQASGTLKDGRGARVGMFSARFDGGKVETCLLRTGV